MLSKANHGSNGDNDESNGLLVNYTVDNSNIMQSLAMQYKLTEKSMVLCAKVAQQSIDRQYALQNPEVYAQIQLAKIASEEAIAFASIRRDTDVARIQAEADEQLALKIAEVNAQRDIDVARIQAEAAIAVAVAAASSNAVPSSCGTVSFPYFYKESSPTQYIIYNQ